MMVGVRAQELRQERPMNDIVAPLRNAIDFKAEAYRDPWSVPLDEIDVSNRTSIPKTPGTAFSRGCGATIRCTSVTAHSTVDTGR